MNHNQKILLGIGIVAGLCLCAGAAAVLVFREMANRMADSLKTDPAEAAEVSKNIAEFDLPPGYEESMAMSFFTYDMVSISPASGSSDGPIIIMMQYGTMFGADPDQMQEQFERSMQQQTGQPGVPMKVVETRNEIIRGEEVLVTISEGTSEGFKLRQWMTVFRGDRGPTLLMIQGPAEGWDDELVETFIHSIR